MSSSVEEAKTLPHPSAPEPEPKEKKKPKVKKEKGGAIVPPPPSKPEPTVPLKEEEGKEGGGGATASLTAGGPLPEVGSGGDGGSDNGDSVENVYVMVVSKKIRGLRKKLDRSRALEQQSESGKELDEGQKILLSNKPIFERTMKEYEAIRQQLLEVAKEEAKKKPSASTTDATPPRDIAEVVVPSSPKPKVASPRPISPKRTVQTSEIHTQTIPTPAVETAPPSAAVSKTEICRNDVERLLRLLHVAARHRDIKDLGDRISPTDLQQMDLIAKMLLGQTAPMESNFEQTLTSSVKRALYYLHPEETGLKELGTTYPQLEHRVNELAAFLSEPDQVPVSPGTPDYNFFADSSAADLEEQEDVAPSAVLTGLVEAKNVVQGHGLGDLSAGLPNAWTGGVVPHTMPPVDLSSMNPWTPPLGGAIAPPPPREAGQGEAAPEAHGKGHKGGRPRRKNSGASKEKKATAEGGKPAEEKAERRQPRRDGNREGGQQQHREGGQQQQGGGGGGGGHQGGGGGGGGGGGRRSRNRGGGGKSGGGGGSSSGGKAIASPSR